MRAPKLTALWRRLPKAWRRRFWLTVQALRRAVLPLRVRAVWRRGARGGGGVVIAGLFRDTRGIAQAARLFALALEQDGVRVHRSDAGEALGMLPVLAPPQAPPCEPQAGTLISCLNPPELLRWLDATGGRELRGRRHIGYWAWELPKAPAQWRAGLRYVDEVWCPSEFAAAAIRELADGEVPVRSLPHPVAVMGHARGDRGRFALAPGACVVLAAVDLRSSAARKNPLGALEAYLRAQPRADGAAVLVCKLSGIEAQTQAAQVISEMAARRSDVRLLTEFLSEGDMQTLIASSDIVLSLHRAEGFGLLAAEAAWLGKAVVTTGWSAPVEFLDPAGAALVKWTLAPVDDPQGQYGDGGALWAEPDIDDAARHLRRLIDDPALRRIMGAQARRRAQQAFGVEAWSEQARALLRYRSQAEDSRRP